ncbi:hypothetical protein D9758_016769 [Tetrapyrgos nigripes]|uniref:Uncharacterized protein n=2 Tax=Tetrapyrgos nigripes TaxID=182062 RepID=A0A8H5CDX8_9AGAR|nr:hypothetical protein D9758_016769 [Tetrapyrgos nigripes]
MKKQMEAEASTDADADAEAEVGGADADTMTTSTTPAFASASAEGAEDKEKDEDTAPIPESATTSTSTSTSSNNDANAHAAPLAPNADAMHPTPYTHSPLTTLLLDDSPLKARLQPYNHFCVPEYSRDVWARDGRVVLTSFMSFGIEGGEDSVADAVPGTAIDMGGKSAEGSEEREREREEGRGVEATEGPTETETEIPIDEDAITEDVVANTSTDSIATVPNSPATAKQLKRKRTLNDTGSMVDISASIPTIPISTSPPLVKGSLPLPSNVNLATDTDIGLILQKTKSSLSDMSISVDSRSSASVKTIATEIIDDGDPLANNSNWGGGGTLDMDISTDGHRHGLDYDGMPPPPLPPISSSLPLPLHATASQSFSGVGSDFDGSVNGGVDRGANANDNPGKDKRIPRKYDETILAVIGVLDAIKLESNVAAWMRGKRIFSIVEEDDGYGEGVGNESQNGIGNGTGIGESIDTDGGSKEKGKGKATARAMTGETDSEEDDEELERLYERNITKSLKDTTTTTTTTTISTAAASTSIFVQPAGVGGAKPKKERWRKKRKVDLGQTAGGGASRGDGNVGPVATTTTLNNTNNTNANTPISSIPAPLPPIRQAPAPASGVPAPVTTSVVVNADAPMPDVNGADFSVSNPSIAVVTDTDMLTNEPVQQTSSSPPPGPPSSTPPDSNNPSFDGPSAPSTSTSTTLDTTKATQAPNTSFPSPSDSDEIPGLGQFVFQGNLPPPEGADVIDVDAMDLDTINELAELDPNRWFQYRQVRKYWIRRGRKALEELGIDAEENQV